MFPGQPFSEATIHNIYFYVTLYMRYSALWLKREGNVAHLIQRDIKGKLS